MSVFFYTSPPQAGFFRFHDAYLSFSLSKKRLWIPSFWKKLVDDWDGQTRGSSRAMNPWFTRPVKILNLFLTVAAAGGISPGFVMYAINKGYLCTEISWIGLQYCFFHNNLQCDRNYCGGSPPQAIFLDFVHSSVKFLYILNDLELRIRSQKLDPSFPT